MTNTNNNNEFKGYSLFNDLEDKALQIYSRARTLVNIMEDHAVGKDVSGAGLLLCMGYFKSLPENERQGVHEKAEELLKTRKAT